MISLFSQLVNNDLLISAFFIIFFCASARRNLRNITTVLLYHGFTVLSSRLIPLFFPEISHFDSPKVPAENHVRFSLAACQEGNFQQSFSDCATSSQASPPRAAKQGRGNESVSGGDREPRLTEPQRDSSARRR